MKKKKFKNNFYILIELWNQFSFRRKYQFLILILIMAIGGIMEMIAVTAVLPFITIISYSN